jgi:hypothetical protein
LRRLPWLYDGFSQFRSILLMKLFIYYFLLAELLNFLTFGVIIFRQF